MRIQSVIAAISWLVALSLLTPVGTSEASSAGWDLPSVSGPITGGAHDRPFTSAAVDLAAHGYVEEEYFLDGTATIYGVAPGTTLGTDGHWSVTPAESAGFKTRILVRRPERSFAFNGTVVVEWLNVTGGWDIDAVWAQIYTEVLRSGYAWVGVSAQRASVNGPPVIAGISQPLTDWDPERYGDLVIPDDAASYDIFSQAARVVGPDRRRGTPDPMDGLRVRRVLATGASQSAHRLATYVDGIHPLVDLYDGYLILGRFGRGAALAAGIDTPSPLRMRTDLTAPVLTVNTESEALAHFAARQPDTATLRYWEVAGGAHQPAYVDQTIDAETQRDLGFPLPPCDRPTNAMPVHYVLNAALDHLNEWARDVPRARLARRNGGPGVLRPILGSGARGAPRSFAPISISGAPPAIERDAHGNALGGIRLPELQVPTAQYGPVGSPESLRCDLRGFTVPFSEETLAALYPDHQSYVRQVSSATFLSLRDGIVLPVDAREIKRDAASAPIP